MITDRLIGAIRAVVKQMTARYEYGANIRYRVSAQDGDKVKLDLVKKDGPWPRSVSILQMPGAGGYDAHPAIGSMVLVSFAENDPSLPFVTHFVGPGGEAFVPVSIEIGGTGRPAARVGDMVAVFLPPLTPVTGVLVGTAFAGSLTVVSPLYGTIQTGSNIVKIGGA